MLIAIPKTAMTGNAGTLKFLCKLGSFTLNTQTATHTIVNANKVPKLVICARSLIGVNDATTEITVPKITRFLDGTPLKGFTFAKV